MTVPTLLSVIFFLIVNGVSGNGRDLANEKGTAGAEVR